MDFRRPAGTDFVWGDEPGTVCRANFRLSLRDEGARKRKSAFRNGNGQRARGAGEMPCQNQFGMDEWINAQCESWKITKL